MCIFLLLHRGIHRAISSLAAKPPAPNSAFLASLRHRAACDLT